MLDPLAALGLAGNIIQFVDFGAKLVAGSVEIYHSMDGALPKNLELTTIVKDLSSISASLGETDSNESRYRLSKDEIALANLAEQCKILADKLLDTLQDLTVKNGPHKKWKSVRQALRSAWDDKDIHHAQQRLEGFRSQLVLRLVAILNDKQSSVLTTMEELSYSHSRMEMNSKNALADLKEEILTASADVKKSREEFKALSKKVSNLIGEAGKLATEQEILNSLRFKTMRDRHLNIVEAHAKTFDWLLEKPSAKVPPRVKFLEWLRSEGGLYWIAGKAGSGKSTLMKYLTGHPRVREALEEWAGSKPLFTGSYFFWSAGNEMMKSQQGLLQSLLYDILRQCPAMIPVVTPSRWLGDPRFVDDINGAWTRVELLRAFEELTTQNIFPSKLCFFVDGLDEYEGDPVEVVDILKDFAASSDIKICLSSRPWTELECTLSGNPDRKLILQDFTRNDIKIYIHDKLERAPQFQKFKLKNDRFQELSLEILNKAQGVFLWVFLVVRSLLRGLTHEDTILDLQRRLKHIPPDLESYFMQMLSSIEDIYRPQTAQILKMCIVSPEPLRLMTFSFLDEEDVDYAIHAEISPWTDKQLLERSETVGKRVKARCRDLLEIIDQSLPQKSREETPGTSSGLEPRFGDTTVDFLHRTVRDFFLTKNMQAMMSMWLNTPFNAHLSLCQAFLAQLKIISWQAHPRPDHPLGLFGLVDNFLYHAREFEERTLGTHITMIDEVDRVIFVRCSEKIDLTSPDPGNLNAKYVSQKTIFGLNNASYKRGWILTMAVQAGLKLYVAQKLDDQPHLLKGVQRRPLLYCALLLPMMSIYAKEINTEMVRLLLDRKADPNQAYDGISIWGTFLRSVHQGKTFASSEDKETWVEAIQLLLEHGADPDASFETGRSSVNPTFSGRTLRYPVQKSAAEVINECFPKDYARLNAILERKREFNIWKWLGWK